MKELNTFRNFLNENKGIAADYADRILGAGEGIDPIALIDFYAGNLDDLPEPMKADLFMANLEDIKARVMQENELHEGTWSLGSPEQIGSIIDGLVAIRQMADDAQNKKNAAGRGFVDGLKNQLNAEGWNSRVYRIVGDDSFHDHYDAAKSAAQLNDFDRVKNALGDAIERAKELQNTILKNRDLEEGELHEGTWALGSVAEMVKVMGKLSQIRKMGAAKGGIELENLDNIFYNVFGDDAFHDAIDAAKETDDDDRFNNFMSDAEARAKVLYKDELRDAKEKGETGFEFKPRFGLEENDAVLDEIVDESFIGDLATRIRKRRAAKKEKERFTKGLDMKRGGAPEIDPEFTKGLEENDAVLDEVIEETVFDDIDNNMKLIAVHMDAVEALEAIVAEFQAISGGTKMVDKVLKSIVQDYNLTGDAEEYASIGFEE